MLKYFNAILIVGMLSLSLVGCGGGMPTEPPADPGPTATEEPPAAEASESDEP